MPSRLLTQVRSRSCSRLTQTKCNQRFFSSLEARLLPDPTLHIIYPPEHPRFIEIPRSVQPQAILPPIIKGRLPIPREIFAKGGPRKTSPKFIAATTQEPTPRDLERIPDVRVRQAVSFKQRQAEQRRQNLRHGISELHRRKQRIDRAVAARSSMLQASNQAARDAPEREDERLTKPSILSSDLPQKKMHISDRNPELALAAKRERTEAFLNQKQQDRKEMLHTLYVNAQDFITTSEQLDEAIDRAFDDPDQFKSQTKRGHNVWNLGEPDTTVQMLGKLRTDKAYDTSFKAVESEAKRLVSERMTKLGEELTGGKA